MNIVYLVVFKDGTLTPSLHYPSKADYPQDGTRFFSVPDNVDLASLSWWVGRSFTHNKFTEIEPK